jgi:hypothetical protein
MDDRELAQKRADLDDKLQLIAELQDEAAELARQINDEEEARKDAPGTVHDLFPRPTDQGSQ